MDSKETKKSPRKINRSKALALLGIAVAAAYVVPTLTSLGSANASGGNKGGFLVGAQVVAQVVASPVAVA